MSPFLRTFKVSTVLSTSNFMCYYYYPGIEIRKMEPFGKLFLLIKCRNLWPRENLVFRVMDVESWTNPLGESVFFCCFPEGKNYNGVAGLYPSISHFPLVEILLNEDKKQVFSNRDIIIAGMKVHPEIGLFESHKIYLLQINNFLQIDIE